VTEVGQLNYDTTDGWTTRYIYNDPNGTPPKRQSWEIEATDSAVQYVVGNWWDVMMIPPQGYVKLKTWINVPWQDDTNSVEENSNNVATWVFHCHILRHEDRGMMMIVKTKKK
jgi:FtsP/CotA-like multicopper oxidase with cupredoxin domain